MNVFSQVSRWTDATVFCKLITYYRPSAGFVAQNVCILQQNSGLPIFAVLCTQFAISHCCLLLLTCFAVAVYAVTCSGGTVQEARRASRLISTRNPNIDNRKRQAVMKTARLSLNLQETATNHQTKMRQKASRSVVTSTEKSMMISTASDVTRSCRRKVKNTRMRNVYKMPVFHFSIDNELQHE